MIGTIRKHSSWLWYVIAGLTIISFVWFMGSGPARNNRAGGGLGGSLGTIYGHEVTPEAFQKAQREFFMYYWMQHGKFPNQREGVTDDDIRRESYIRLLISEKAKNLGINVNDDSVAAAAAELLSSLGRNHQPMPMDQFVQNVLQPENLALGDLQNYLRSDLAIQQTIMALGLPGALIPPQEASQLYDHEYQEVSAQAVFFSYSNYLSQVTPTPAAVQDFYTKNLAAYREPDRVQVSYVAIELTNFLASAELKLGKTNLDNRVDEVIRQQGMEAVPGAKTVDEAKAKIRDFFIRQEAIAEANPVAKDFATTLYAQTNLAAVARQKGFAVHSTAPFANNSAPDGLPDSFVKAAFKLTPDQPFSEMVSGTDAIYLLALDRQIPSTVPTLEQISSRVNEDFRATTAQGLARNAGAVFQSNVTAQVAAGKTFAQAAAAAGFSPAALKPFSLSSGEIPEAGERAEIGELKQAAFTTPLGKASNFFPTSEGGFVLSPHGQERHAVVGWVMVLVMGCAIAWFVRLHRAARKQRQPRQTELSAPVCGSTKVNAKREVPLKRAPPKDSMRTAPEDFVPLALVGAAHCRVPIERIPGTASKLSRELQAYGVPADKMTDLFNDGLLGICPECGKYCSGQLMLTLATYSAIGANRITWMTDTSGGGPRQRMLDGRCVNPLCSSQEYHLFWCPDLDPEMRRYLKQTFGIELFPDVQAKRSHLWRPER